MHGTDVLLSSMRIVSAWVQAEVDVLEICPARVDEMMQAVIVVAGIADERRNLYGREEFLRPQGFHLTTL